MPRFTISDVTLDIPQSLLTPAISKTMRNSTYEWQEVRAIKKQVKPEDTILEIGAGVGLTTVVAAGIVGGKNVVAYEANPALLGVIEQNFALNNIKDVTLLNQIVLPEAGKTEASIYIPTAFWAATIDGLKAPSAREQKAPAIGLDAALALHKATVLVCDAEGAEADYFQNPLPESLRMIVLELHPNLYPPRVTKAIFDRLSAQGFGYAPMGSTGPVVCFKKIGA